MANKKISDLAAGSALDGTERFEAEQPASTTSVYLTGAQLKTLAVGAGSVSVASGKTLTASNTLTLTATDGSTLAIGTGGTLGSAAYTASSAYLAVANNLSDLNNAGTSRTNLGLGSIATQAASAVAITGGTIAGLTGLAIRDTSAAFDVTLAGTSATALTAGRTLTLDVGNVAHTLALGTTANTITFPNAASGTVPLLNLAQTFTAQQTFSSAALFADGTTSLPGIAFSAHTGTGFTETASGRVELSIVGNPIYFFGAVGYQLLSGGVAAWASSSSDPSTSADIGLSRAAAGRLAVGNGNAGDISGNLIATTYFLGGVANGILTGPAAATLQLGAADAASAVAQILRVQSVVAGTSNTAGADWTLNGGVGTGTGAGGKIILQTAPAGASSTSQNALAAGLTITAPAINMQPSVVVGNQALATSATDGFIYIPGGAGAPTGVPTSFSGRYPLYWNTTNKKLYVYDGAWLGGTAPGVWS